MIKPSNDDNEDELAAREGDYSHNWQRPSEKEKKRMFLPHQAAHTLLQSNNRVENFTMIGDIVD